MGSLREVIAETVERYGFSFTEKDHLGCADAILTAIRAHFAKPGAVTDEMVGEFSHYQPATYFPLTSWADKTRAGIAAALQKME